MDERIWIITIVTPEKKTGLLKVWFYRRSLENMINEYTYIKQQRYRIGVYKLMKTRFHT